MWKQLNKLFVSNDHKPQFILNNYFFVDLKRAKYILSSHVNSPKALIQQVAEIGIIVEKYNAMTTLLNNLP